MDSQIRIMPTMDCEPPKSEVSKHANEISPTGPASWKESEKSIRGFVNIFREYDLVPTLFIQPQVVKKQRELFLELEEENVCLGLHLHPYKMDEEYEYNLGEYQKCKQKEIIDKAIERWQDALGKRPDYFRPGAYSASDVTFSILEDLEFRGGSISVPGWVKPELAINWAGAEPYPHRAHNGFRILSGDNSFIEIPHLGDFNHPVHSDDYISEKRYQTIYLSAVEQEGNFHENSVEYNCKRLTRNLLKRFIDENPPLPVLTMSTHNNMDYSNSDHKASQNVHEVVHTLENCEEELRIDWKKATIETVINEFQSMEANI